MLILAEIFMFLWHCPPRHPCSNLLGQGGLALVPHRRRSSHGRDSCHKEIPKPLDHETAPPVPRIRDLRTTQVLKAAISP